MKVYVVVRGAYSDQYIAAVFTTRELAEAYIEKLQRVGYEHDHWQPFRRPQGYNWLSPGDMERMYPEFERLRPDKIEDVPEETYEHFVKRNQEHWEFGTVAEHELWDVLPVVQIESEDELRVG